MTKPDPDPLAPLFDAARTEGDRLAAGDLSALMARVLAEAPVPPARPAVWRRFAAVLADLAGGWPQAAGLAAAAVAGLMIGTFAPAPVALLWQGPAVQAQPADLLSDYDALLADG